MKKPIVYIAGPYTKLDPAVNTREAILIGQRLRDAYGIITFVPHFSHFEHMLSPRPYDYWLAIDFDWIRHCHALLRLPGESSGADAERKLAESISIPVLNSEN